MDRSKSFCEEAAHRTVLYMRRGRGGGFGHEDEARNMPWIVFRAINGLCSEDGGEREKKRERQEFIDKHQVTESR